VNDDFRQSQLRVRIADTAITLEITDFNGRASVMIGIAQARLLARRILGTEPRGYAIRRPAQAQTRDRNG
jgi:hypothetical protein